MQISCGLGKHIICALAKWAVVLVQTHRLTESLRLEKISEIIESIQAPESRCLRGTFSFQ